MFTITFLGRFLTSEHFRHWTYTNGVLWCLLCFIFDILLLETQLIILKSSVLSLKPCIEHCPVLHCLQLQEYCAKLLDFCLYCH